MAHELEPVALPPEPRPWRFGDGRPKNARNRITSELRSQFEQYFEHWGADANPLIILAEIARNPQVSPATREKAAHDLAKFLVPAQIMMQKEPEEGSANSTVLIEALQSLFAVPPVAELPPTGDQGDRDVAR
jgi:hypothetical protein